MSKPGKRKKFALLLYMCLISKNASLIDHYCAGWISFLKPIFDLIELGFDPTFAQIVCFAFSVGWVEVLNPTSKRRASAQPAQYPPGRLPATSCQQPASPL